METDHQSQAKTPTTDVKWEVDKHTKLDGPTDAYGELEFTGAGQSSKAKVSTTTLFDLLTIQTEQRFVMLHLVQSFPCVNLLIVYQVAQKNTIILPCDISVVLILSSLLIVYTSLS